MRIEPPTCPYCKGKAVLVDSSFLYGGKSYGNVWMCHPCDAYVGTHPNGKPLGRLANKELRELRKKAHAYFDRLWKAKMRRDKCSRSAARKAGYKWLAEQLDMPVEKCHIAMFGIRRCKKVIEVCTNPKKGETPC